jgi:hypothetical protein
LPFLLLLASLLPGCEARSGLTSVICRLPHHMITERYPAICKRYRAIGHPRRRSARRDPTTWLVRRHNVSRFIPVPRSLAKKVDLLAATHSLTTPFVLSDRSLCLLPDPKPSMHEAPARPGTNLAGDVGVLMAALRTAKTRRARPLTPISYILRPCVGFDAGSDVIETERTPNARRHVVISARRIAADPKPHEADVAIERKSSPENHDAVGALADHRIGGNCELSWIAGAARIVIRRFTPTYPEQEPSGL